MAGLGGWPILGSILGLITLALAIAAGVWLGRWLFTATNRTPQLPRSRGESDSAREVLRRRYAAGEIDEQELDRRLAGLNFH